MLSARVFVCHDLDLSEVTRTDTQVFQLLCQRLQETGAEVVTYTRRAAEEAFLAFLYAEISTCHWFLLFQTPEVTLVPAIHTAVNIAQMRVKEEQMQGILRFLMLEVEDIELVPEWSSIPTVGASYDYPRAVEKLILALTLHGEITDKAGFVTPPPPPPPVEMPSTSSPLLLSVYDAPVTAPTSAPTVYGAPYDLTPSIAQPAYNPRLNDSAADRPPPLASPLARLRAERPGLFKLLFIIPGLILLLAIVFGLASPLSAMIAARQNPQRSSASPASIGTAPYSGKGIAGISTPQATVGTLHTGRTPTPTSPSQAAATPGAQATSAPKPQPTPTPKPKPQPTPTPKPPPPCPATIQYGSTGSLVKTLQNELNARGMVGADGKALTVDGQFGPNTQYAVRSWQTRARIQVDGIVGPQTWHSLGNC